MLLLASASPARRRLLEQAGIAHRVQVSGVDEEAIADPDPLLLVQRLARAKAEAVAMQLKAFGEPTEQKAGSSTSLSSPISSESRVGASSAATRADDSPECDAVLGCDSLLVFAGEVFGKPASAAEAVARWQRMSGGRVKRRRAATWAVTD